MWSQVGMQFVFQYRWLICLRLFTFVYVCLRLFTFVYVCLRLFTFVCVCLRLFAFVCVCLHLFAFVYVCLRLFTFQREESWGRGENSTSGHDGYHRGRLTGAIHVLRNARGVGVVYNPALRSVTVGWGEGGLLILVLLNACVYFTRWFYVTL